MKTFREPCGCKHDGYRWLQLCDKHGQEARERHEQASRDYRRSHPAPAPAATDWLQP